MEDNRDLLEEYRSSIDNVDAALIHLLAERFRITHQVGVYKAENGLPAEDKEREAEQVKRMRELAEDAGMIRCLVKNFCVLLLTKSSGIM